MDQQGSDSASDRLIDYLNARLGPVRQFRTSVTIGWRPPPVPWPIIRDAVRLVSAGDVSKTPHAPARNPNLGEMLTPCPV